MNTHPDDVDPAERQLATLLAAARASKLDTSRAEYGFETRLLAQLSARKPVTPPWTAWTWRLAPVFAVVALSLSLWTGYATGPLATDNQAQAAAEWSAPADDDIGGLVLDDFLASS